jgi:hypothetical protein
MLCCLVDQKFTVGQLSNRIIVSILFSDMTCLDLGSYGGQPSNVVGLVLHKRTLAALGLGTRMAHQLQVTSGENWLAKNHFHHAYMWDLGVNTISNPITFE